MTSYVRLDILCLLRMVSSGTLKHLIAFSHTCSSRVSTAYDFRYLKFHDKRNLPEIKKGKPDGRQTEWRERKTFRSHLWQLIVVATLHFVCINNKLILIYNLQRMTGVRREWRIHCKW